MPWFKVDDKLHDHKKTRLAIRCSRGLDPAAIGLWVLAGSWCADNQSDGFIPISTLKRWSSAPRVLGKRLESAGYWTAAVQDDEDGYRFHDWEVYQPTKAQKLAEREAKSAAGRKGGIQSGRSRREANTKQSASGLVEADANARTRTRTRTRVEASSRLTVEDLSAIQDAIGGDREYAYLTADFILSRAKGDVRWPLGYVMTVIADNNDAYRYRRGNPTRTQQCPTHPGEWADNCRACALDRRLEPDPDGEL